jgi:3-isopropylmalate dehydratase large subunit/3-isopropylmalate dehydratase small subunit
MQENCREFGLELFAFDSPHRGIVHVIGPELGATQPGKTIVCGDSHTSTHGAFGALAFGIGTTEVGHVLATQCLLQRKPKTLAIDISGPLRPGVTAKDVILATIAHIGVDGGTGHVIEYRGEAIAAMDMEARMTVCNMSIEAGARAGMIGPDDTTFAYLHGRPRSPKGREWDEAVVRWRKMQSDPDALYDKYVSLRGADLQPMVTFGTNPGMAVAINDPIPAGNPGLQKALDYMRLSPGKPLTETSVDVVFVGSCTNSRLSDLKQAAAILRGRKVAPGVTMLVVPGSQQVKREAEELGLDDIFKAAGAEWRESGCSMCLVRQHEQSQFRRTSGHRRAHRSGEPDDGGCLGGEGPRRRPPRLSVSAMEPIKKVRSRTVVLPMSDIDTDQIIPARFLTTTSRDGLGQHLFHDWRYRDDGKPDDEFVLNSAAARDCRILVAGRNFGCGSSREHAPWALLDYGFLAVISSEIADIFRSNSLKNGLLPIMVDEQSHRWLLDNPGAVVEIDVAASTLTLPGGATLNYPIDAFARYCLIEGLDQLGFLLRHDDDIRRFEESRPWTQ